MALLLSRRDVERLLTMKDAMAAMKNAFRELALGTVEMSLRTVIRPKKHAGLVTFMPAYLSGMEALGMKLVTAYPGNPTEHNLPTILATILLNDPMTGALLAIMDGTLITAMRTGAVSGVATELLAKENAEIVGIFGTGVQGRTQLMAVMEARRGLKTVKVYDVVPENARKFSEEMTKQLGITVAPQRNPDDVVTGSDIVITATTSKTPVFNGKLLKDGTHVNAVGSHHGPGVKELDQVTMSRAKVVVDQKEACLKEAGDLIDPVAAGIISSDHIYAELGELVVGKKKGRINNTEITVFKSVGLAIQDAATALRVYELAKTKGIGQSVEI